MNRIHLFYWYTTYCAYNIVIDFAASNVTFSCYDGKCFVVKHVTIILLLRKHLNLVLDIIVDVTNEVIFWNIAYNSRNNVNIAQAFFCVERRSLSKKMISLIESYFDTMMTMNKSLYFVCIFRSCEERFAMRIVFFERQRIHKNDLWNIIVELWLHGNCVDFSFSTFVVVDGIILITEFVFIDYYGNSMVLLIINDRYRYECTTMSVSFAIELLWCCCGDCRDLDMVLLWRLSWSQHVLKAFWRIALHR